MWFRILAELVLLIHLAFVCFVVAGGLLAWLWAPRLAWLHVPVVIWGAYVEISGTVCPLTPLENYFRRQAGLEGYGQGFIEHYLLPVLYPAGLDRTVQLVLGLGVLALNLIVYASWYLARR